MEIKNTNHEYNNALYIISVFFLSIMGVFLFLIIRFRPCVGDDILNSFTGGLFYYVHPEKIVEEEHLGKQYATLSDAIGYAEFYYFNWGGRLLTGMTDGLLVIAGRTITAIIGSLTYVWIVIAGLRLVFKKIGEVLRHPFFVVTVGALILLYNNTMDMSIMRVMISLYGFSLSIYLLYLNLCIDCLEKKENQKRYYVLLNVVGFVAGITHELLGTWFILQIFFQQIKYWKKNGFSLTQLKQYIGLLVGYLICFLSPGNFIRLYNPHEKGLSRPLSERMRSSFYQHITCITEYETMGKYFFVVLILVTFVSFVYILIHKEYSTLHKASEFLGAIVLSVFLWGMMPYTRGYALMGIILYSLLGMVELVYQVELLSKYRYSRMSIMIPVILMIMAFCDNLMWIPSMVNQAVVREKTIEEAVANNQKEVFVHKFSDECDKNIMMLENVDEQGEYDWFYTCQYYGTHVVLIEN